MIFIISEILQKYYDLKDFTLIRKRDFVIIIVKKSIFYLYKIDSLKNAEECEFLSSRVPYCDVFVSNIYGQFITTYQANFYILIHHVPRQNYRFFVFSFYSLEKEIYLNWRSLWIQKSDYLSSFYLSVQGKYSLIDESISYYIGLLEMGIFILKDFEGYHDFSCVQHKVFDEEQYFNPLNLVVDLKERDFAEYLKYIFWQSIYKDIDICNLIQKGKNIFQYDLVIARMLLPNYYFSIIDDVF